MASEERCPVCDMRISDAEEVCPQCGVIIRNFIGIQEEEAVIYKAYIEKVREEWRRKMFSDENPYHSPHHASILFECDPFMTPDRYKELVESEVHTIANFSLFDKAYNAVDQIFPLKIEWAEWVRVKPYDELIRPWTHSDNDFFIEVRPEIAKALYSSANRAVYACFEYSIQERGTKVSKLIIKFNDNEIDIKKKLILNHNDQTQSAKFSNVSLPSRDYERMIAVRIFDWKRLKNNIEKLLSYDSDLSTIYSILFGISGSAGLSIIPIYMTNDLPSWITPAYIIVFLFSLFTAIIFFYLDIKARDKLLKDKKLVVEDIESIEKFFDDLKSN